MLIFCIGGWLCERGPNLHAKGDSEGVADKYKGGS
jgi:hypothetical protein